MGRKQSSNAMANLANQITNGDELLLANRINETFQSVSAALPKLEPTYQHSDTPLPDEYHVSVQEVEKKLMAINIRKATGPDNIPNWVLRDFAGYLSGPLSSIFNSSFREGFIPEIWKCADVVPLPKVNPPKRLDKDLRPISLTPTISKVQERFVYAWYWEILKDKMDNLQFGALKGTCTTHALILMMHEWMKSTDDSKNKNFIHIVLLDYAKAFDHIDPNILVNKLAALGIPAPLLRWAEAFLTKRHQRVKIGQYTSAWLEIWGTVPQGTLLGVLFFLCMINDLSTECKAIKYVDDTTIYHTSNNPNDNSVQKSVSTAIEWSTANSMKINTTKTKDMIVSFAKEMPNVANIEVCGVSIERVETCKLLGVTLNNKLTWHNHIDEMMKKANTRLHFVTQLRKTKMTSDEIIKIFITLVRPMLEYTCELWHSSINEHQTHQIESIQERALNMAYPSHAYEVALRLSGLPTLKTRRVTACRKLFLSMQDCKHKLHSLLPPRKQSHYSSRNAKPYPLPRARTNRYKNSFVPYCLFNF